MKNPIINNALFTDFYELTMAQGYWKNNMNHAVVFDMFFRRQPFNGGFSVFAGLENLIDAITDFTFGDDDIEYLRSQNIFEEGFLEFLKDFRPVGIVDRLDKRRDVRGRRADNSDFKRSVRAKNCRARQRYQSKRRYGC